MRDRKEGAALALACLLQCGILLGGGVFGGHMRLAWWTTLYPQSLYETGIADADGTEDDADAKTADGEKEKKSEPVHIKFRLAEWIGSLFAD